MKRPLPVILTAGITALAAVLYAILVAKMFIPPVEHRHSLAADLGIAGLLVVGFYIPFGIWRMSKIAVLLTLLIASLPLAGLALLFNEFGILNIQQIGRTASAVLPYILVLVATLALAVPYWRAMSWRPFGVKATKPSAMGAVFD